VAALRDPTEMDEIRKRALRPPRCATGAEGSFVTAVNGIGASAANVIGTVAASDRTIRLIGVLLLFGARTFVPSPY
jgi:hypothetical protein